MYYAISGIGWGKGESIVDAVRNYSETAIEARPSFVTRKQWVERLAAPELEPSIYKAPEGATGFVLNVHGVVWTAEDGKLLGDAEPIA